MAEGINRSFGQPAREKQVITSSYVLSDTCIYVSKVWVGFIIIVIGSWEKRFYLRNKR